MKAELEELDKGLYLLDPQYPINGSFLQKIQFINSSKKLSLSEREMSELTKRANAEGETRFKQYIQKIFALYPYED